MAAMAAASDAAPTVTDRLRADILSGVIPPGDRLIEIALAERYQVGRAAIRAALVELDGEGLVRREANRIAFARGVLNTAISIFYYLKLVMAMYFREPTGEFRPVRSGALTFVLVVCGLLVLQMGMMPSSWLGYLGV